MTQRKESSFINSLIRVVLQSTAFCIRKSLHLNTQHVIRKRSASKRQIFCHSLKLHLRDISVDASYTTSWQFKDESVVSASAFASTVFPEVPKILSPVVFATCGLHYSSTLLCWRLRYLHSGWHYNCKRGILSAKLVRLRLSCTMHRHHHRYSQLRGLVPLSPRRFGPATLSFHKHSKAA